MRISDWSSDVCSSDLFARQFVVLRPTDRTEQDRIGLACGLLRRRRIRMAFGVIRRAAEFAEAPLDRLTLGAQHFEHLDGLGHDFGTEIGRASCRERVCQYV